MSSGNHARASRQAFGGFSGHRFGVAVLCAMAVMSPAFADLLPGAPIVILDDATEVTIEFLSSEAGYTGNLYFLGWGSEWVLTDPVAHSDDRDLGRLLFNNHRSAPGSSITLAGTFDAGDFLYFAYDIEHPRPARDTFRWDVMDDRDHFAFDADTGTMGIEDLRKWDRHYDGDFNDLSVGFTFAPVPAPGSLVLLAAAGACFGIGRRRL